LHIFVSKETIDTALVHLFFYSYDQSHREIHLVEAWQAPATSKQKAAMDRVYPIAASRGRNLLLRKKRVQLGFPSSTLV